MSNEPVYGGLTQTQLDAQYEQRTLVPDAARYITRWAEESAQLRRERPPRTVAYGEGPEETLHFFKGEGDGLHIHLHGGAWRALSKEDASFVVRGLGADGSSVAVLDFGLAPATALPKIVAQVRSATRAIIEDHCLGRPAVAPVVSGHSSGAHLASCLLDRRWLHRVGLHPLDFGGFVLASGPYDLEPVRLSARNEYLHLSPQAARDLTVAHHLPGALPPLRVFSGDGELDEFRRQGAEFARHLSKLGRDVRHQEIPSRNHFQVYDDFADPGSPVVRAASELAAQGASAAGKDHTATGR